MRTWRVMTLSIVLLCVVVPLVAVLTTWPLTPIGVFVLAPALAAIGLVLYFNWRGRLKSRTLSEPVGKDRLARAG